MFNQVFSLRNSKSEDQLQLDNQDVEDIDISTSVHTLTKGTCDIISTNNQKTSPNGKFAKNSDGTSPLSSNSPDLSTSSLISCSEHYNGESVLDNISPKSASSPDTPEWSLIDSFHKSRTSTTNVRSILSPVVSLFFVNFNDIFYLSFAFRVISQHHWETCLQYLPILKKTSHLVAIKLLYQLTMAVLLKQKSKALVTTLIILNFPLFLSKGFQN